MFIAAGRFSEKEQGIQLAITVIIAGFRSGH